MTAWQTDRTENITFATSLAGGNKEECVVKWSKCGYLQCELRQICLFTTEIDGISVRLSEQWQHNINDKFVIEQSGAVWWAYSKSDDYDKKLSDSRFQFWC